ncbi:MAG: hypothetical protein ACOYUB_03935 [Patescibacteria group bacterium]
MVYALTIDESTFPAAKYSNLGILLNVALPLVMAGAGLIFLSMMLMGAFNIITHGDQPDALKKAYSTMTFAVVGLLIVIASFLIVRVIGSIIGAQLLPQ